MQIGDAVGLKFQKILKKIDKIDESILPQVTEILDDTWHLPFEHKSIIDFIVDLYKCELSDLPKCFSLG